MKLIVVVGPALSGKDMVAEYLSKEHGFFHVSTGEIVRKHIKENNLGRPGRVLMQNVANELRAQYGTDYFIKEILEQNEEKIVVSGLRAPGEIDAVRIAGGKLIFCDANENIRYERAVKRNRTSDRVSFSEFLEHEKREVGGENDHKQNLEYAKTCADFKIINDGDLNLLYKKIDQLLSGL